MSTTRHDSGTATGGQGAQVALALAALVLLAGLFWAASRVPRGDEENPTNGEVIPGKVSVIGEAKVRRWTGEDFTMEIPLNWAYALDDKARRTYGWTLLRENRDVDTKARATAASNPNWTAAQETVVARVRIEIRAPKTKQGKTVSARTLAYDADDASGDSFVDLGSTHFPPAAANKQGRAVWRLEVSTPGTVVTPSTIETHYYFATCDGRRQHKTWHIVLNRSALDGRAASRQQAVFATMMGSLETPGQTASSNGRTDCVPAKT